MRGNIIALRPMAKTVYTWLLAFVVFTACYLCIQLLTGQARQEPVRVLIVEPVAFGVVMASVYAVLKLLIGFGKRD